MSIDQLCKSAPVIFGQIKATPGDAGAALLLWCRGTVLSVQEGSFGNVKVLDRDYTLGKMFTIKIVSQSGDITVYYNDMKRPAHTYKSSKKNCYFKLGNYNQVVYKKGSPVESSVVKVYSIKLI